MPFTDANANVEAADTYDGRTPLSWAAENGHVDVVKSVFSIDRFFGFSLGSEPKRWLKMTRSIAR